jgi:hypothetical protein
MANEFAHARGFFKAPVFEPVVHFLEMGFRNFQSVDRTMIIAPAR